MKKFINILIVIVLILVLSSISTFLFYNKFCTLNQTTDWNAVSALANIALAIITIISVCFAIYIPNRDRIESSKIQLYKQRFELYYLLQRMMHDGQLSKEIMHGQTVDEKFDKTLQQASFLVNEDDRRILDEIKHSTVLMNKTSEEPGKVYFKITIPTDGLRKLDEVFIKYLDIGSYGIKK